MLSVVLLVDHVAWCWGVKNVHFLSQCRTVLVLPLVGIDVNSLQSLLVPREKCTVGLALTRQEWRAVLSGLKDVKKLKELCVYMRAPEVRTIATQAQKVIKRQRCISILGQPYLWY